MRIGIIFICFSLVSVGIQPPIVFLTNTDGPTFPLEVTTEKYYYEIGEEVNVTMTNVGDEGIVYMNPPNLQVLINPLEWVRSPCPSVAQVVITINAGEKWVLRWDQEYFFCNHPGDPTPPNGEQVPPGKYKLIAGSGNAWYAGEKRPVADSVWIEIGPAEGAPVADAGPDQTLYVGDVVQFKGSGSYDPDGDFIFSPGVLVNDVTTDDQGAPRIAVDPEGNIHVVWADNRDRTDYFLDVYYSKSINGGLSFEPSVRMNDDDTKTIQTVPVLSINDNLDILVAWTDGRDYVDPQHPRGVYFAKSTDGGQSFGTNVKVNDYPGAAGITVRPVAISSLGTDHVFLTWEDTRNVTGEDIYFSKSTEGGKTFDPNVRVNDDEKGGIRYVVSMDVDSEGNVYVIWMDTRVHDNYYDIYFSKSTDGGLTFEPDVRVDDADGWVYSGHPDIAVDSEGNINAVWDDDRDPSGHDIYFSRSTNGGSTFGENVRVTDRIAAQTGREPFLAVDSHGDIYATWYGWDNGSEEILFSFSTDGGQTFRKNIRVNNYTDEAQTVPAIAVDQEGIPHSVWQDERHGSRDIYYARGSPVLTYDWNFDDGSPHGTGKNPVHVYDKAGIYNVTLTVTDTRGASDSDHCIITVLSGDQPPVADAGSDQSVHEGDTVLFDGTDSYDPDGGIEGWSTKTDIPSPRAGGGSATLNGQIYYVGGGPFDLVPEASSISQKYNPSTDTWSDLPDLPEPRAFLGVAAVNGRIYAIGGRSENQSTNTTYEFDPATNSWTSKAPVPIPIEAFGTAVVNDKIYLVGGWSTFVYCYPCAFVFEYNPSNDSWSQKPDIPTGRAKLAATVLDDKIFAIGGHPITVSHMVEVYDPATGEWSRRTNLTTGRWSLSAEVLGGNIYAFGGIVIWDLATDVNEMFDSSADSWVSKPSMLDIRMDFGSGVVGDCVYAIGGYSGFMAGHPNSSEEYCLDGELLYEWDFDASVDADGDGNHTNDVDATGPTPTHVYGDDGNYIVTLKVTDGTGKWDTDTCVITVSNLEPTIAPFGPFIVDEGIPLTLEAVATDEGSDDLTFAWEFELGPAITNVYYNDGVGSDPHPSPWGPYPFTVTDTVQHTYGDDGVYSVRLTIVDDDMGSTVYETTVTVNNVAPTGGISGLFFVDEGSPMTFEATATDQGSDDLTFTWNWGDGTPDYVSAYYNDGIGPDPYPSPGGTYPFTATDTVVHTYGDNAPYTLTLTISDDDGSSVVYATTITVYNVAPTIEPFGPYAADEGSPFTLEATATDPGSDDLTFAWEFELGSTITNVYYNDGVGPDPYPSPGGTYPFTATDTINYTYGDNGLYNVTLTVEDDDSGTTTYTTTIMVNNVAPTIEPFGPFVVDEGSQITAVATANDPGSDDLTFSWEFELGPTSSNTHYSDGIAPDPYPSPGGTYPFSATDSASHTYGDNYDYLLTLDVCDDDGGCTSYDTTVIVNNVAPTIEPFGPFTVYEGTALDLIAISTDAGSDDLTFDWEFELGPTITEVYYNDGVGPDPYPSPGGTFPFSVADTVQHTYGDNGVFDVTLTVEDDDGGTATYTANITVNNVAPTIDVEAYILVNFTLRVAGEKWHNVELFIHEDGEEIGYAEVVRYPGSPDDQTATTGNLICDVTTTITAKVLYTPDDDPINGQTNGANPAWVTLTFEDGSETRLKHTFNVKHPETWEWNITVNPHIVGHEILFEGTATDPGSDDLTFNWNWGDGTPDNETTYYNDGLGPDPYPSPGGTYPSSAMDGKKHTFTAAGEYTVTLTVTDDDGGVAVATVSINIP